MISFCIHTKNIILIFTCLLIFVESSIVTNCCSEDIENRAPCLSYDNKLMATSLDEAMFSFPNLASPNQSTLFNTQSNYNQQHNLIRPSTNRVSISAVGFSLPTECSTFTCLSCKLYLVNGFLASSNLEKTDNATFIAQRDELALKLGTTQGTCNEVGKRKKRSDNSIDEENFELKSKEENFSTTQNILGIVTKIGCEYKRGNALYHNSNWCGLCNLCWQWRKLPSDYFPVYLNEVSCDDMDGRCLSGFGKCKPIVRAISAMKKRKNSWEKVTIETISACECQVKIGTPIHDLIVK